jgi:hypothetical protein
MGMYLFILAALILAQIAITLYVYIATGEKHPKPGREVFRDWCAKSHYGMNKNPATEKLGKRNIHNTPLSTALGRKPPDAGRAA